MNEKRMKSFSGPDMNIWPWCSVCIKASRAQETALPKRDLLCRNNSETFGISQMMSLVSICFWSYMFLLKSLESTQFRRGRFQYSARSPCRSRTANRASSVTAWTRQSCSNSGRTQAIRCELLIGRALDQLCTFQLTPSVLKGFDDV